MFHSSKINLQSEIAIKWTTFLVLLAFLAAVVAGVVVSTGKPIPIIIYLGGFASLILMIRPVVLLWVLTATTLLIAGSVAYSFPGLSKIWWAGYILAFILFVPALLHFLDIRNVQSRKKKGSGMIYPLLGFVIICGLSTFVNSAPLWPAVLAVKSMFLYGGVWAALSLINFSSSFMRRWLLGLLGIGLIQVIPTMYQYLFVRASRIQAGLGDITASDSVVGTFGGTPVSGGLGAVLALYIVILILCLLSFRKSSLITRGDLFWTVCLLILPLILTEVKVIFVYLPIAFLFLYKDVLKTHPLAFITGSVLVVSLSVILLVAYQMLHWSARDDSSIIDNIMHHFSYSFEEKFESESGALQGRMTRRQVLEFWWEVHHLDEPVGLLIGHGLGASRTQGLAAGYIAKRYDPLAIDLTSISLLLWDVGLLGTSAFLLMLVFAVTLAGRLGLSQHLKPWQRALAIGLKVSLIVIIVSLFYRNDIPYAAPMMFILMVVLGLLEWLRKQQEPVY